MTTKAARERIRTTLMLLSEKFPKAFNGRRQPLKLGIHRDVEAALADAATVTAIKQALHFYVTNQGYIEAIKAGASRIDLDGNPAGVVTTEEAHDAMVRLQRIKQLLKPVIVENKPPPPPPQMRDGLAALRAAAVRRRGELER